MLPRTTSQFNELNVVVASTNKTASMLSSWNESFIAWTTATCYFPNTVLKGAMKHPGYPPRVTNNTASAIIRLTISHTQTPTGQTPAQVFAKSNQVTSHEG